MDFKIMKKIVFGLLMTMGMLNAQNNLVFNQVLLLELSTTTPAIVPEGKVWKIEGFNSGGTNVSSGVSINDNIYYLGSLNTGFNSPTWLPENTEIKKSTSSSSSTFNVNKISVLEFNVVPTSTGTGSGTGGGGVSSDGLIFSQMINEAIIITPRTSTTGTVLYSFQVPAGHIWKIREIIQRYWNENFTYFQDQLVEGFIKISVNGEPFIYQNAYTSSGNSYEVFLKEGSYEITWYSNDSSDFSGNRIFLQAIEYRIP